MYLGRSAYFLNGDDGVTDALLISHLLAGPGENGRPLVEQWKDLMEITLFFAGLPDDICYPVWRDFVVKVLGTDKMGPEAAVDPKTLKKIVARLDELPTPRIKSDFTVDGPAFSGSRNERMKELRAFKIFGQRFTFDAWWLSRLSPEEQKSGQGVWYTPSALFVPTILGENFPRICPAGPEAARRPRRRSQRHFQEIG